MPPPPTEVPEAKREIGFEPSHSLTLSYYCREKEGVNGRIKVGLRQWVNTFSQGLIPFGTGEHGGGARLGRTPTVLGVALLSVWMLKVFANKKARTIKTGEGPRGNRLGSILAPKGTQCELTAPPPLSSSPERVRCFRRLPVAKCAAFQ